MALFGTQRDAKFLASINAELLNAIVDTEIEFYKLIIEDSNSNIYGESVNKTYYNYILIPALITKEGKRMEARLTIKMDDDAFVQNPTHELSRILSRLSEDVERIQVSDVGHMVTAADINGNKVGELEVFSGEDEEQK